MLHNLALQRDIPLLDDDAQPHDPPADDVEFAHGEHIVDDDGTDIQQEIITNYFS